MIGTDQRIRGHLCSSSPTEKSVAGRFLLEKSTRKFRRETRKGKGDKIKFVHSFISQTFFEHLLVVNDFSKRTTGANISELLTL